MFEHIPTAQNDDIKPKYTIKQSVNSAQNKNWITLNYNETADRDAVSEGI